MISVSENLRVVNIASVQNRGDFLLTKGWIQERIGVMDTVQKTDPEVARILMGERARQEATLEMIASENYASSSVLEALSSSLSNKYAEGYPGKRYYGGAEFADAIESLAITRARELFLAEHANVQPHSGASANLAAYMAVLAPGDTVLGMDLSHGGHLTHGHPSTLPAKVYRFVSYGTEPDGSIDYEKLEALALKERPKLLLAGFSSYTRSLDHGRLSAIAEKVGAVSMMDMAHIAGLVAANGLPSPVPFFDIVTATTHKTLRGPRGGMILCKREFAKAVDAAVFPGIQGGPHMNTIAAKAVAFAEASTPLFHSYAKAVLENAKVLEQELLRYEVNLIFGGTDNHMLLLDTMSSFGLSGKESQEMLEAAGISVNKNVIPDDPRSPIDPSGIRIGTPSITTRGMGREEMREIAMLMCEVLRSSGKKAIVARARKRISALCRAFPTP